MVTFCEQISEDVRLLSFFPGSAVDVSTTVRDEPMSIDVELTHDGRTASFTLDDSLTVESHPEIAFTA